MTRILIVHPDLTTIGDAEKLAIGIIKTLLRLGHIWKIPLRRFM